MKVKTTVRAGGVASSTTGSWSKISRRVTHEGKDQRQGRRPRKRHQRFLKREFISSAEMRARVFS
jgi:hypothetical protein